MAKIKFSGIGITEASGKLNTEVIARNTAGFYTRPNTPPSQPDTTYQVAIRERMTEVAQMWAQLDEAERLAWNVAAENDFWVWAVRLEKRFRPSGQQLFLKVNMATYLYNFPILSPPEPRSFTQAEIPLISSLSADAEDGMLIDFNIETIPTDTVLQIWATASLSPGFNRPRPTLFRLILEIESAGYNDTNDITEDFQERQGAIYPAKKIFIQTALLDTLTGRKVIIEKQSVIVTGELPPDELVDPDDNIYPTVIIGDLEWSTVNWKSTKYANGDTIPLLTDSGAWNADTAGAMCWYNNDEGNKATFGGLYNFYTYDRIAPAGWRVPTLADWAALATALGGASVSGGKLKQTGTGLWNSPNTGADNSSGFTGLPAGLRNIDGTFSFLNQYGAFNSSTGIDSSTTNVAVLAYNSAEQFNSANFKKDGNSIRLCRDV